MRTEFARLLKQMRKWQPDADLEIVRKAYRVANSAHSGQVRLSGEPYITHSLAVAKVMANIGLDRVTIAAGLLHDVLEDTEISHEWLVAEFGEEVANLVDGVTKLSALSSATQQTREEKHANNMRKMLIAMARDVRVILIKLADRLHNMRTIEHLPDSKRLRISQETLDIYAPLAHRLGIARWRWELEDHAFHQLKPAEYKEMAGFVSMKRREREAWLKETVSLLEIRLTEAEVVARVIGRPKHLYSIYRKTLKRGTEFDQVHDSLGVRIIAQTVSGCYNALGVVHHLWTPVPGRFKDYIAMPKVNMYQSIHTTVMRENGLSLEVQIRTEDMDLTARQGIAAHWKYKEGVKRSDKKMEGQLQWLRQMYEWLQESHAPDELLDSVRRDFTDSDIYVFTPRGEVKEMPSGATPLDFAYMIHSDIGHHCIGARVNAKMVPIRYNLQTGDVVEILTSKNQVPHLDWVDVVVTGRARSKIRQKLREIGALDPAKKKAHGETASLPRSVPQAHEEVRDVDSATRAKLIRIEGLKGMEVQFGKCCNPMPGHQVVGYVTKSPGITVHRVDCRSFTGSKRDRHRIIAVSWEGDQFFETAVRVTIGSRPNVLADITSAMRPMNVDISNATYSPGENSQSYFDFVFECSDESNLERITRTLKTVAGVTDVAVISPETLPQQGEAAPKAKTPKASRVPQNTKAPRRSVRQGRRSRSRSRSRSRAERG